jgi:hypothetical protein
MAMEIVNGYPCRDCTDAEKAKKGIDPSAGPTAEPGETKADVKARESDGSSAGRPVDGRLPDGRNKDGRGINRPLAAGNIGTALNILV